MKKTLLSIIYILAGVLSLQSQTLYSTTTNGTGDNNGTLYSFVPATNSLTLRKAFQWPAGLNPSGSLLQASNGKLYGTTIFGGSYNYGTIYSFEPSTGIYTTLHNFENIDGSSPMGGLIQARNGKLYGMTEAGGPINNGFIYSYDPATSGFTIVHYFDGPVGENGAQPFGKLFEASNGKIYGLTRLGGANNLGVIFSLDPATSLYTKLRDFKTATGSHPFGNLIQGANGNLYGMTSDGGDFGVGVIFSYHIPTGLYTSYLSFNIDNGATPYGSLTRATNGKFYGLTFAGGNNDAGVLFEWIPGSPSVTKLKDLSGTDGSHPYGHVYQAKDGKLYSVTTDGGANNLGVIFSYNLSTSTYTKLKDLNTGTGANPYWGSSFVETGNTATGPVKYYRDADGDGYGDAYVFKYFTNSLAPAGYVQNDYDCNDHKTASYPGYERVRMCDHGIEKCAYDKDIDAQLALGWTLGRCPRVPASARYDNQSNESAEMDIEKLSIPLEYRLFNYPNPFAGASTIQYALPVDSRVSITVYDGMGRIVSKLVDENKKAGTYTVKFNAERQSKASLYYKIIAVSKDGRFEQTNKMIQIR